MKAFQRHFSVILVVVTVANSAEARFLFGRSRGPLLGSFSRIFSPSRGRNISSLNSPRFNRQPTLGGVGIGAGFGGFPSLGNNLSNGLTAFSPFPAGFAGGDFNPNGALGSASPVGAGSLAAAGGGTAGALGNPGVSSPVSGGASPSLPSVSNQPISAGTGTVSPDAGAPSSRDVRNGQNGHLGFSYAMKVGDSYHGCQGTLVSVTPATPPSPKPNTCGIATATHCLTGAYQASSEKGREAGALVARGTFIAGDFGTVTGAKIYLHPGAFGEAGGDEANDGAIITIPCDGNLKPVPIRTAPPAYGERVRYAHRINGVGMSTGTYLDKRLPDGTLVGQLFKIRMDGTQMTSGDSGGGVYDQYDNMIGALQGGNDAGATYSQLFWAQKVLQNLNMQLPPPRGPGELARAEGGRRAPTRAEVPVHGSAEPTI